MTISSARGASRRLAWPLARSLPPLAPFPSAPSIVRAQLGIIIARWQLGALADTAELVVSELATNAMRASTDEDGNLTYIEGQMPLVKLRLFSDGVTLLIEVHDMARGTPRLLDVGTDAESGRGLTLVHALTGGHWGWRPSPPGKCVWAALRAED